MVIGWMGPKEVVVLLMVYSFHHMLLFLSFIENEDFSEQS